MSAIDQGAAPTRRALLTGMSYAAGAAIVTGGIALASEAKGATPDAAIEAAWQRRVEAYAIYNALPADTGPVVGGYAPGEREQWHIIDDAEEVIRSSVATTPRGAMIQLWCAMFHSVTGREQDDALTRGDFAAIDRLDGNLDWNARLVLAALRSLQSMEG